MKTISVCVAYAEPEQQTQIEVTVVRGSSVEDALKQSEIMQLVPNLAGLDISDLSVGIYAQKANLDTLLEAGDRVEIYRPLTADPKEVRRQLAKLGKTIGTNMGAKG